MIVIGTINPRQSLISEQYASYEDSVSEMLNSLNETNIKDVYGMNLGKGVEGNIECGKFMVMVDLLKSKFLKEI